MARNRRMYCKSCRQTFLTSDVERCSLCGASGRLVDPTSPDAVGERIVKSPQQLDALQSASPGSADPEAASRLMWRAALPMFAGLCCLALAIACMVVPRLGPDYERAPVAELFGMCVLGLAGVALCARAIRFLREMRDEHRARFGPGE